MLGCGATVSFQVLETQEDHLAMLLLSLVQLAQISSVAIHERLGGSGPPLGAAFYTQLQCAEQFKRTIKLVSQFLAGSIHHGMLCIRLQLQIYWIPHHKASIGAILISILFHLRLGSQQMLPKQLRMPIMFLKPLLHIHLIRLQNRCKCAVMRFMSSALYGEQPNAAW